MELLSVITNAVSRIRRESIDGRDYIVAPLTLIVPGVLPGSKGPLYYPPDEVARNYRSWNGTPLVVYHPTDPISNIAIPASTPGVLDRVGIGIVQAAHIDNSGRLRAEGWFDVANTGRVDRRVLTSLERGASIELSTGLFTDNEIAPTGALDSRGRPYTHIARNYRPDHVAILPDQLGACSINDGCGVLVNRDGLIIHGSPDQPRDASGRWTAGDKSVADELKDSFPYPRMTGRTPAERRADTLASYHTWAATAIHKAAHGDLEKPPAIPPAGAPLKKLQQAFDSAAVGLTSLHARLERLSSHDARTVAASHPAGLDVLSKAHQTVEEHLAEMHRTTSTLVDRLHEEYSKSGMGGGERTELTPGNVKQARMIDTGAMHPSLTPIARKLADLLPRSDVLATGGKRIVFPDKATRPILQRLLSLGVSTEKVTDKAYEIWHSSKAPEQAPVSDVPEYLKGHTVHSDSDKSLDDADRYKRVSKNFYMRMKAGHSVPKFVHRDSVPNLIGVRGPSLNALLDPEVVELYGWLDSDRSSVLANHEVIRSRSNRPAHIILPDLPTLAQAPGTTGGLVLNSAALGIEALKLGAGFVERIYYPAAVFNDTGSGGGGKSYFGTCERDDKGHCLPSGESGADSHDDAHGYKGPGEDTQLTGKLRSVDNWLAHPSLAHSGYADQWKRIGGIFKSKGFGSSAVGALDALCGSLARTEHYAVWLAKSAPGFSKFCGTWVKDKVAQKLGRAGPDAAKIAQASLATTAAIAGTPLARSAEKPEGVKADLKEAAKGVGSELGMLGKGVKLGAKVLFSGWTASQSFAERVAKERGASADEAKQIRASLSAIDIFAFKPLSYGLHVGGGPVGHAINTAMWVIPPATGAYLAHSLVTSPRTMARAAKGVVKDALGGLGKGAGSIAKTLAAKVSSGKGSRSSSSSSRRSARLSGPEELVRHSRYEVLGAGSVEWAAQLTTNADGSDESGMDNAHKIVDALEAHNYDDWYVALLHMAMSEPDIEDMRDALALADYCYRQGKPKITEQDDDLETLTGMSSDELSSLASSLPGGDEDTTDNALMGRPTSPVDVIAPNYSGPRLLPRSAPIGPQESEEEDTSPQRASVGGGGNKKLSKNSLQEIRAIVARNILFEDSADEATDNAWSDAAREAALLARRAAGSIKDRASDVVRRVTGKPAAPMPARAPERSMTSEATKAKAVSPTRALRKKIDSLEEKVRGNPDADPYLKRDLAKGKFHKALDAMKDASPGRASAMARQLHSELDDAHAKADRSFGGGATKGAGRKSVAPLDDKPATQATLDKLRPHLEKLLTGVKGEFKAAGERERFDKLVSRAKMVLGGLGKGSRNKDINRTIAGFEGAVAHHRAIAASKGSKVTGNVDYPLDDSSPVDLSGPLTNEEHDHSNRCPTCKAELDGDERHCPECGGEMRGIANIRRIVAEAVANAIPGARLSTGDPKLLFGVEQAKVQEPHGQTGPVPNPGADLSEPDTGPQSRAPGAVMGKPPGMVKEVGGGGYQEEEDAPAPHPKPPGGAGSGDGPSMTPYGVSHPGPTMTPYGVPPPSAPRVPGPSASPGPSMTPYGMAPSPPGEGLSGGSPSPRPPAAPRILPADSLSVGGLSTHAHHCKSCGEEIDGDYDYCPSCGEPVDNANPALFGGQARHEETGQYQSHGSGTGKGPAHKAAKEGYADTRVDDADDGDDDGHKSLGELTDNSLTINAFGETIYLLTNAELGFNAQFRTDAERRDAFITMADSSYGGGFKSDAQRKAFFGVVVGGGGGETGGGSGSGGGGGGRGVGMVSTKGWTPESHTGRAGAEDTGGFHLIDPDKPDVDKARANQELDSGTRGVQSHTGRAGPEDIRGQQKATPADSAKQSEAAEKSGLAVKATTAAKKAGGGYTRGGVDRKSGAHRKAWAAHLDAAAAHEQAGNADLAEHHLKAGREHLAIAKDRESRATANNTMTGNDFDSDAQRRAFFGVVVGGGSASKEANAASEKANAGRSPRLHEAAAGAHRAAAKAHSDAGRKDKAREHEKSARGHEQEADSYYSTNTLTGNKIDPEMAHMASKQAASASLMTEHPEAIDHAMGAMGYSAAGDRSGSASGHVKAAKAHEQAGVDAYAEDDQSAAEDHHNAAAMHRKAASLQAVTANRGGQPMTRSDRSAVIDYVANCNCSRARASRRDLAAMSDAELLARTRLALNTEDTVGSGSKTVQVGGEEDDDDADDWSDGKVKVKKTKGPGMSANMNTSDWLRSAPPEVRSVVQNAMQFEAQQKAQIIEGLITNVYDPDARTRLGQRLQAMNLNALRDFALLHPPAPTMHSIDMGTLAPSAVPSYLGAAGAGITGNSASIVDDVLPLPTMNWKSSEF